MPRVQHAAPASNRVQPAPPRQGFQQRVSPQPQAVHPAAVPFWQESAASQQVYYDPQQVYTAVPGERPDIVLVLSQFSSRRRVFFLQFTASLWWRGTEQCSKSNHSWPPMQTGGCVIRSLL